MRATSDGYILPNPGVSSIDWGSIVDFLGEPELDNDKFRTGTARMANTAELGQILDRIFLDRKKDDLFYAAHQRRFIYGLVQSPEEVMTDQQYRSRGYFVDIDHLQGDKIRCPGAPVIMNRTPGQARRPAPTLGQHNSEVLRPLPGCPDDNIGQIRAS
jgi:crotonobetainyl-CoA:carnitine CoA-transferase CaiB-like acyl-CoA transferase